MTATILRADARSLPLPDASVDLIVTSPPYFALRSYTDGGEHYAGQIGAEPTPAEYIASLIACTREWMRVLKPSGSLFVNLGDKYAGSRMDGSSDNGTGSTGLVGTASIRQRSAAGGQGRKASAAGVPTKSLMMLPERYRIAAVDELGLIARAVLVWSKPNGLPESVTDRVRRSHEDWVHLTKLPRYFSAVDEIREGHVRQPRPNERLGLPGGGMNGQRNIPGRSDYGQPGSKPSEWNPLGKLPGSVWEIATEPLKVPDHLGVDHFAAFPTEFPRRIVQGWSPSGICTACGEGRRPVTQQSRLSEAGEALLSRRNATDTYSEAARNGGDVRIKREQKLSGTERSRLMQPATITGEACACPDTSAPTRPSVVLDPFGGTGTTALVASVLGRHGISVDMSADYCRLARWRTQDPGQRAKAARVTAPPKQMDGQADLFGELVS